MGWRAGAGGAGGAHAAHYDQHSREAGGGGEDKARA